MPRINGTRRPTHTEKAAPKAKVDSDKSTKKASEKKLPKGVGAFVSSSEGPTGYGRDSTGPAPSKPASRSGTSVSSYSSGGEGATYNPPAPRETYTYPTRNVWSSGGGGE